MKVEYTRLLIVLLSLLMRNTNADVSIKRQQCRDFTGDRSNCQRFIRCFHNLRVLFTCAQGTAYVPDLQTCVATELVNDCDDSKNRIDITISSNTLPDGHDDYPTIEADLNALEAPMQKSLSSGVAMSVTPRQFGCSSFCYNQGVCVLVGQSITCRCAPGFIGTRCQVAQYAISTRVRCDEDPGKCKNGATCVDDPPLNTYICICTPLWAGPFCDYPADVPGVTTTTSAMSTTATGSGVLCSTNPCLNGATCNLVTGGGFICICPTGYSGLLCDVPGSGAITGCYGSSNCPPGTAVTVRNQCQPNPCQNGGNCYLNAAGFACACPTGYTGTCCEITLAASNPCLTNPCLNSGTCRVIAANTYRCECPAGLLGVRCEQRICDPNPCLYGGQCLPYLNSFQCICPAQYTGRCCELLLVTTTAPSPCTSQPCVNGGTCRATSATVFVCSCPASYYGRCCELRNYCQPNPCYNGGACVATTNAYICQCIYPNSGSNCELTVAAQAPQPFCACILCPCPIPVSTVTNPCLPNPCQNNGGCSVVQSTPQCHCTPNFTGYYCQYTRKRSLSNAQCANVTCSNGGECYTDENGPHCTCPKPYFGEHCELINRPRTCNPSPCGKNGQCISTKEGHKCVCKNGKTGVLCEQIIMPENYRWCPLDCHSGTSCVYEGSTPKCRVLSVY